MDSINKQQPEESKKNLWGDEAVKKIQELAGQAHSCFFCTDIQEGKPFSTRPMTPQKIDESGHLWFLSPVDSHKNEEVKQDAFVQLLFQGSHYSDFMSLYGKATVSRDKEKIKELWDPTIKTWFTEGVDDPRISVIKVVPEEGYYWDTKHGMIVAFTKQMIGAAIGQTIDDSIEGTLKV